MYAQRTHSEHAEVSNEDDSSRDYDVIAENDVIGVTDVSKVSHRQQETRNDSTRASLS